MGEGRDHLGECLGVLREERGTWGRGVTTWASA